MPGDVPGPGSPVSVSPTAAAKDFDFHAETSERDVVVAGLGEGVVGIDATAGIQSPWQGSKPRA
jgi:hypothetical protein